MNLAAPESWKFDRPSDAQTDLGEFQRTVGARPSDFSYWPNVGRPKELLFGGILNVVGGRPDVGGAMAKSSIDDGIHRHFQSSVRGATSDDWFESLHASKELGNGVYTLPVFATAWAAANCSQTMPLWKTSGRWGERSLRGFVVGAPP